jgi:hypothetical protein
MKTTYIYITLRRIILKMKNVSDKICGEYHNTQFMFNNFSRQSCHSLHNVETYVTAGRATDDNIIGRMRFGCWMFKRYRHTLTLNKIYCSATATMETWTRLNIRLICSLLVLLLPCLEFAQTVVPCRFWAQRSRTYVFKCVQKTPTGDMLNLGCFKELLKNNTP